MKVAFALSTIVLFFMELHLITLHYIINNPKIQIRHGSKQASLSLALSKDLIEVGILRAGYYSFFPLDKTFQ